MYLTSVTFIEWWTGTSLQDQIYLYMFLGHLLLGIVTIIPLIIYVLIHLRNTKLSHNKKAIKAGYTLFIIAIVVLVTGLLLTRGIQLLEVNNSQARSIIYWLHVISPVIASWVFIMHRLAGRKLLSWQASKITIFVVIFILIAVAWNMLGTLNPTRSKHAEINPLFAPSFAQTHNNKLIAAKDLDNNLYCQGCHADIHAGWMNSVHKVSSFNNTAYAFAVNNTREKIKKRDGSYDAARLCGVCHDPVLVFSGEFDKDIDFSATKIGQAGITCTTCHAISDINSVKGNGSYTLTIPQQYPFTYSQLPFLQWVNQTLVKAKPDFHKASYLKPLHKTAEFCSVCHKVALPKELNHYKWLRGQNHYDSFFLSAIAGHAVAGFYYPEKVIKNCADCHMPMQDSDDFGAITTSLTGQGQVHSHYFEAANSGIRYLNNLAADPVNALLTGSLSIDLFGIRKNGVLTGELIAPLNDNIELESGQKYLFETVIKNARLGHSFTQGTSDSNQVWVEFNVYHAGELMATSGGIDDEGKVDKWSYFINAWLLDKDGKRIDKRNVEDIFTALYNHSIPAGAATVVHYLLDIPKELTGEITIETQIFYRKFDTTYYRFFTGEENKFNDLPIVTIAQNNQTITIKDNASIQIPVISNWQRWNNYGIGLMRKQAFKQAEYAFTEVAKLGYAQGWINLVRIYLPQGRLTEAQAALELAKQDKEFEYIWQLAYFAGMLDLKHGNIQGAIDKFARIYATEFSYARNADFDFSKDYRFVTLYAQTVWQRSTMLSGKKQREMQQKTLLLYTKVLELNPEWADAHYGLFQLYTTTKNKEKANYYKNLHQKYKVDDYADDTVIIKARAANKVADHAAGKIVIYNLKKNLDYMPVIQFIENHNISTH